MSKVQNANDWRQQTQLVYFRLKSSAKYTASIKQNVPLVCMWLMQQESSGGVGEDISTH